MTATFAAHALVSRGSEGYCRMTSCASDGACSSGCGTALSWPDPCVGYSLQRDGSRQVSFAVAQEVFASAFASWTTATCNGGTVALRAVDMGAVACKKGEFNRTGGN